jgi:O-antigen ligase
LPLRKVFLPKSQSWDSSGLPAAHNGYIEIFLAGGLVACSLLGLLLLSTALRINKALAAGEEHAVARFAILCVALIANF